jgi:hypothetical protein
MHPLPAQEHVLDDVEVVAQREVLVDRVDAEGSGVARGADAHRLALPVDLAAVRRVDAGDALDEHRLAGAVVADEGGHLARPHVEVHVDERLHRAEALGDALEPQQRRAVRAAVRRLVVPGLVHDRASPAGTPGRREDGPASGRVDQLMPAAEQACCRTPPEHSWVTWTA